METHYNVGGFNEWKNIDWVKKSCVNKWMKNWKTTGTSEQLITFVKIVQVTICVMLLMPLKLIRIRLETFCNFRRRFINNHRLVLANQKWLDNVTSGIIKTITITNTVTNMNAMKQN